MAFNKDLPKPKPGEIWEVYVEGDTRISGPVFLTDYPQRPRDWHGYLFSGQGDQFEFNSFPGQVDLTKKCNQPHPSGWAFDPARGGWHDPKVPPAVPVDPSAEPEVILPYVAVDDVVASHVQVVPAAPAGLPVSGRRVGATTG